MIWRTSDRPGRIPLTARFLIATTLLVGFLALANRFDPLQDGLSGTYYADSDWSPDSIVATQNERPSTERLMAAWVGDPPPVFSASWTGSFLAVRNGTYIFSTTSDDGSWVYVDGQLVVDNGGRHGPIAATGAITLNRGVHAMFVKYRQEGRDVWLDLSWGHDAQSLIAVPSWALTPRTRVGFWRFVASAAFRRALTGAIWLWLTMLFVAFVTTVAAPAASRLLRIVTGQDWESGVVVVLLTGFVLIGISTIRNNSLTYDETDHYRYGVNILAGNSTRFEDSEMPLSALNALPKRVASLVPAGILRETLSTLAAARVMTLACSTLVAVLVFYWSRSLYGFLPALVSLILYVFDPNIIAHSALVTTDVYALGTITFAFYCLWRVVRHRTVGNGLLCAAALGMSQLAKYTAVVLFPLFLMTILMCDARAMLESYAAGGSKALKTFARKYVLWGSLAIAMSIAIINVGFLFNRTFTPFGRYALRSAVFQGLQRMPVLAHLPVPVPYPYLEGLDWVVHLERTGESYGDIYLLGRLRKGHGFKGYYAVASLLKTPIAIQIVTMPAVAAFLVSRRRRTRFLDAEVFLLLPAAFFVVYFNFVDDAQIGIRHYLVVAPFLYVFAGRLFAGPQRFTVLQKTAGLSLCGYLVVSVLSYHPYYLSYFNEIVWNRTRAYKYLADSNVDWGQGSGTLNQYLAAHPDVNPRPNRPVSGRMVVSVNDLIGIHGNRDEFAWLREHFEPVDTIAYSYLIYEISSEDLTRYCSSSDEC